jgi:hypothetical protein
MLIRLFQAGPLHLQSYFMEDNRLFLIHNRWLTVEGAALELEIPSDLGKKISLCTLLRGSFLIL